MKNALLVVFALFAPLLYGQSCSQFNNPVNVPHLNSDTQEHVNGSHSFKASLSGGCTYTDGAQVPGPCNVTCSAQAKGSISESGDLAGLVFFHGTGSGDSSGVSTSNGGAANCQGLTAGTVKSCIFPCNTSVNITAGASGNGGNVGVSVSFPPGNLWSDQLSPQAVSCLAQDSSTLVAGGGGGDNPCPPVSDTEYAQPDCSPIIIDVEGEGFHLTSAAGGVMFDIRGGGHPVQIAWTAPGYRNAFLALDRNHNGTIDSGMELFGNFTAQPKSPHPNGFLALAEFDKPENGGNGDGVIDEHDAVFSQLRLWIDENHDGVSQPNELHTLPELGIYSLSLSYFESRKTDEFGNQFRYKARVNPGQRRDPHDETPSGLPGRWAYDVFLMPQ
jgi:hypothetical protein